MNTAPIFQSRQISAGLRQTANPYVRSPTGKVVELEGVIEQPLGQPDARLASRCAESVTPGDEVGNLHERMSRGKLPPPSRVTSLSGEMPPCGILRDMHTIDRDRLRKIIADKGLSARSVSLAVSSNATLLRDILNGRSQNARGDTIAKIAHHLGVSPSDLMTGNDAPTSRNEPQLVELPVRGQVQAGAWLLIDDVTAEPEYISAARDPRFPRAEQWLSRVRGDSMNNLNVNGRPAGIYDGDLVHCVDAVAAEYQPRTGDIVEVERVRFQGQERELTLKQVEVTPNGILLWPRSTNPRWQEPLSYQEGDADDVEVRIRGWVVSSLRQF